MPPLTRGRELTALFYGGRLEQLWATFLPAARARWGSFPAFQAYRAAGLETYGAETSLLNEGVVEDEAGTTYTRTVAFAGDPGNEWTLLFGLDDRGNVRDFQIVSTGR